MGVGRDARGGGADARAGRGAGSSPGAGGGGGGLRSASRLRRAARSGTAACPGARESRCVTGADASGAAGGSRAPADSSESPPRGPGRREAGGLGEREGGSSTGPAAGEKYPRRSEPENPASAPAAAGAPGWARAEGSGDHLGRCRGHLRRAGGGRPQEGTSPTPPALGGQPPGPSPSAIRPCGAGPGRVGSRSRRSRGTSAGPRTAPRSSGFQPPTLLRTSLREGVSVGRDCTSACRPPRPRLPPRLRPAPPPRKPPGCWGQPRAGSRPGPRLFPVLPANHKPPGTQKIERPGHGTSSKGPGAERVDSGNCPPCLGTGINFCRFRKCVQPSWQGAPNSRGQAGQEEATEGPSASTAWLGDDPGTPWQCEHTEREVGRGWGGGGRDRRLQKPPRRLPGGAGLEGRTLKRNDLNRWGKGHSRRKQMPEPKPGGETVGEFWEQQAIQLDWL